jgi:hypothetical protein
MRGNKPTPIAQRLAARIVVDPATGCHNWTGYKLPTGYGQICIGKKGKNARTHRVAYELARGHIPDGLVLDHLCRNPACCNPDHLEAVTMRENTLRGVGPAALAARATHCPQGHPYDETNTYVAPNTKARHCRTCASNRTSTYWERRKDQTNAKRRAKYAAQRSS